MKLPKEKESRERIKEDIMNGLKNLLKLMPLLHIAMISELLASLDVKNTTDIKINNGENRFAK